VGSVASALKFPRQGAVGFIDWLGLCTSASTSTSNSQ
jgi:hypothetical protein